MKKNISDWIEFGQISAERDERLSDYFFENGILEEVIRNRHHFLILGRKGAGKTAVFQHLDKTKNRYLRDGDLSISFSLQNYSWDVHNLLATEGKAPSLAYIQSWKFLIYIACVRAMVQAGWNNPDITTAKKLVSKIFTSPTPSLTEVISQKILQLTRLKLPKGGLSFEDLDLDNISLDGGEISFSEVKESTTLQSALNQSLERVSQVLEDLLEKTLSENRRIFVTFDRIDEAWDVSSFEVSQRIIAGLIGAAETISARFHGFLRPIVFLREDIFDTIDLNDKNKLRADCGQLLAWSRDTLSRMVLERINYFARNAGQSEFSSIEDVFDRDQMRQGRRPFDYIMLRTMVRPRDFIRILQLVKANMHERATNPFDQEEVSSDKLECQSIYNAEPAYSDWLLEELRDEWRVQYHRINDLLAGLQNIGSTTFTAVELATNLGRLGVPTTTSDMNQYLRFLYDNSVIGFRVGNSQQWKFKCFSKSQGFIEAEQYKVHDGLHRGLNLVESRKSSE